MKNIQCPSCKKEFETIPTNCSNCQFPFQGTEREKTVHIAQFIEKKGVLVDSDDSIEKSRKILYAITGINVIYLVVGYVTGDAHFMDTILNFVISGVFFICAFNIEENPIRLTTVPLILLISIYTLNFLLNPSMFFQGIVVKLLIVGSMFYSIYLIKSAEKFKKRYQIR